MTVFEHIHGDQPVLAAGVALEQARAAVLLLHGRGATARDILSLSMAVNVDDVAYLAPQAAGYQWYPYRFIEPIERNQPHLDSALRRMAEIIEVVAQAGITPDKLIIGGFSQGACLTLEYAARNGTRYGGVLGFSGGLIGAPGTVWDFPPTLNGTPIFLGCSDNDFHIPKARLQESADALTRLGANVTMRLYPGMGHEINDDEIAFARDLIASAAGRLAG